ncbi:MAG: tRNA (adenosine(37)-N6)-threonylcarbamoyltransferase complex ATPase subunit type 1 TsaE, partial [Treponema sp.]|nr:tRNA (adenosine(37)-N6)-threonylcarbamoyltransferase complex ATPase subunit type 1 TsaE [Treponema sp.]
MEKFSASPRETFVFGEYIAGLLEPGSVIALRGSLGSGKTCLAKGIACGLGITETITSPTYTIISEYSGSSSITLYHIDAYRLDG